ncbi:MAG: hypothetical protein MI785_14930 [Kiloniellales bacterium]|nr:hypothetical protein [Kiloniellales bacterium]
MTVPTPRKITAAEMRAALRRRFAAPEWAIAYEVAQGTGAAARRRLDAVAMELWPSRGLALHGIEIKVTRQDWRREKAAPEKAEEIARFCDYFWIAAPKDVVPVGELPSAWGLLELDGEAIAERVRATKTEAQEIDRLFLAAMLRAASRGIDPESVEAVIAKRQQKLDRDFEWRVEGEVSRRAGTEDLYARRWRELCEQIGRDPRDFLIPDEYVIDAVALVLRSGAVETWSGLRGLEAQLRKSHERLAAALGGLGVPEIEKPKRRKGGAP